MTSTATTAVQCPTCKAQPGEKCQTVYWIRQEDGSYAGKGKPARTHRTRTAK